ncbi:dynactin subunit, putative [Ixodes scapularis]|uniref:Dynactin subunit, putative n=1 Tax=Ixodes scapularis TaxID=6945 RepID=B7Q631_IXOSC|nr:dynactin subunit, putative [Ixodes scapularis]|eukprot:XP_002411878.1 dynactin subunit, putative [Ixodes scapularis]
MTQETITNMAAPDVLKILEERLEVLEMRLAGNDWGKELPNKSTITELLANVNSKIQAAVASREKLSVLKKTEELDRYLDAEYQEKIDLTEGAKLQLILAEEDRLRQVIAAYQKMEDLKPVLDSEHIKDAPSLFGKVSALAAIQLEQQEEVDEQTQKLYHLLSTYNDLVNTISKQFLLWDNMLTQKLNQRKATEPSSQD